MKKRHIVYLVILAALILSNVFGIILAVNGLFDDLAGEFSIPTYVGFAIFNFACFFLFGCVVLSHKFATGKFQEVLFVVSSILLIKWLYTLLPILAKVA